VTHEMGESSLCENIGMPGKELQAINQQLLSKSIQSNKSTYKSEFAVEARYRCKEFSG
jgi:hypothetical protein